jgi:hypothetical protein
MSAILESAPAAEGIVGFPAAAAARHALVNLLLSLSLQSKHNT